MTPEQVTTAGAICASALAAVKMILAAQGRLNDRFAALLEENLRQQAETLQSFRTSIESLNASVRETGQAVLRATERLVTFREDEHGA